MGKIQWEISFCTGEASGNNSSDLTDVYFLLKFRQATVTMQFINHKYAAIFEKVKD
jgi:hypothetical protein